MQITVHPRRHGEHDFTNDGDNQTFGSSPQARGTRSTTFFRALNLRFIPAGTGNTDSPQLVAADLPVHPRRHGEHEAAPGLAWAACGSSPQARGTLHDRQASRPVGRFIPAGTGNTGQCSQGAQVQPVHPRRHGEHS